MNFWQKIEKPIIGLSPMDGVTDASFRFITAKHGGPDVTFTEFVNVEAAFFAPRSLLKDLTYSEIERPVIAQIYGHTPELFYKVAHLVCELGFDGLDINMGCPAKKVAAKGSGAALIRTPELARKIIRSARQGIQDWRDGQTLDDLGIGGRVLSEAFGVADRLRGDQEMEVERRSIPLSVKTRIGYDNVVVEEWMQTLLEENLAAITLHGRTLKQGYKGSADWGAIGRAVEIAKNSATLILGNGDLKDMEGICRRVHETGVDGVLLGRAAQGNPWIFRAKNRAKQSLRSGITIHSPSIALEERFRVLLEHSRHFEKYSSIRNFVGMRKHLAWYCCDSPGAAELRARMVRVNHTEEVIQCLRAYARSLGSRFDPSEPVLTAHGPQITHTAAWFT